MRFWPGSNKEAEKDTRFVELGRYLCEVRAGQYWPARTSHRYRPSSTKRVSFSASLLLPGQNLIDFGEHELGSPAIELGQHGRILSNEARQANHAVLLLAAA